MEYQTEKVRHISHEVKNQLSVCDLYTEILERYCAKNGIEDETILRSVGCIKRALQMAGNTLLELKSSDIQQLDEYNLDEILKDAYELSKVYGIAKAVRIELSSDIDVKVVVDKNRLLSVILNLVKNACEAFEDTDDKFVKICSQREDSVVKVIVSNNAVPVGNTDIFAEGVTTKETGSGLGLYIARQNMEEMGGSLRLLKSDFTSTDFEIRIKTAG